MPTESCTKFLSFLFEYVRPVQLNDLDDEKCHHFFSWSVGKKNKKSCEKRPFLFYGRQNLVTNVWGGFTRVGGKERKKSRGAHFLSWGSASSSKK